MKNNKASKRNQNIRSKKSSITSVSPKRRFSTNNDYSPKVNKKVSFAPQESTDNIGNINSPSLEKKAVISVNEKDYKRSIEVDMESPNSKAHRIDTDEATLERDEVNLNTQKLAQKELKTL